MTNLILELLNSRNVSLEKICSLVNILRDSEEKDIDKIKNHVLNILEIKEMQDYIILGIILDIYTENKLLPEPLEQILSEESSSFSLDKSLALNIVGLLGPQGIINFSYLQKEKKAEIKELVKANLVNTFLDDIICVIASTASIDLY